MTLWTYDDLTYRIEQLIRDLAIDKTIRPSSQKTGAKDLFAIGINLGKADGAFLTWIILTGTDSKEEDYRRLERLVEANKQVAFNNTSTD